MAYEKQTWTCGETITADKLNHIEEGIAKGSGGGNITFFPLTYDGDNDCYSTTASYNDVRAAMENGIVVFAIDDNGFTRYYYVISASDTDIYVIIATYDGIAVNGKHLMATSNTAPLSACGGGEPIG